MVCGVCVFVCVHMVCVGVFGVCMVCLGVVLQVGVVCVLCVSVWCLFTADSSRFLVSNAQDFTPPCLSHLFEKSPR